MAGDHQRVKPSLVYHQCGLHTQNSVSYVTSYTISAIISKVKVDVALIASSHASSGC